MKIIFGSALDGRSYPDFVGPTDGWLDVAAVGPRGLVQTLELQLGLTRPQSSDAVRTASYVRKLARALEDDPEAFFATSFRHDPWATATTMLEWRDRLVAAGWRGAPCGAPRVDALAKVEAAMPSLPLGLFDRAVAVRDALESGAPVTVDEIEIVEARALLDPCWRGLVATLESKGVSVHERPASVGPEPAGDLGSVARFLTSGDAAPLKGDGSLVLLDADTELMAAEAVAEWIAAGGEEGLSGTVVVSDCGDTSLLDRALAARGLPTLGHSAASPWRGALQILPLAFAIAWQPFDARALLDLLTLPRSPVGRSAAGRLSRALVEEPGTGAAGWSAAWERIEADLVAREGDGKGNAAAVAARLKGWREWTVGGIHPRAAGMPVAAVLDIASRVGTWAMQADAGAGDELLMSLATAAAAMAEAVTVLQLDVLPALLVDRLIEQVLASGCRNPGHFATAGGLRSGDDPAAIWAPARTVVWWDFTGPGRRPKADPWTAAERAALRSVGCEIQPTSELSARISAGHSNGALMASERLLLVRPALGAGEATVSHPLSHQLDPLTGAAGDGIRWRAERMLSSGTETVGGRTLARVGIPIAAPPLAKPTWVVPEGVAARLEGRRESATSFERLIDCQLRWLVRDVLRVTPGRFAELPGADRLLGMLAHAVAAKVLLPGPAPAGDEALRRAVTEFEDLLPAIAAPLQQPEFAGELAAARSRVPAALAHLADVLHARGLEIVGTEVGRDAAFGDGLSVTGKLDLLVRHPIHGLGVIDLKWSRSPKRRVSELVEGRAIQLATYGAIAGPEGSEHAEGGYYLLAQRRLVGLEGSMFCEEEVATARDLGTTWLDLVATWRHWRDAALSGRAVASGLPPEEGQDLAEVRFVAGREPCKYCEFTGLCRIAAVEV